MRWFRDTVESAEPPGVGIDRSSRVRRLFAVCLRVAVRRRLHRTISIAEASQFDTCATLAKAVRAIESKLELYPKPSQFKLALTEAAIECVGASGASEAVRRVRAASTENGARLENAKVTLKLRHLEQEIHGWAAEYRAFLSEVQDLYRQQIVRIGRLHLRPNLQRAAERELEAVFVRVLISLNTNT